MTGPVGEGRTGHVLPLADFTCWQCGACCRAPGDVRLRPEEPTSIARHLGVEIGAFTAQYTRLREDRRGLVLREQADGACIFLQADGACEIQAVKPQQCRDFPYRWNYPGWEARCRTTCAWPRATAGETGEAGMSPAPGNGPGRLCGGPTRCE